MNERDREPPFPPEPWKRLLEASGEEPPETTDARIRAAARRDLAPRGRRWWLPASLAASFVLAVLIVHSEFGTIRKPLIEESDRGEGPAMHGRIVDREEAQEPRAPGQSPKAEGKRLTPQAVETERDEYGAEDSESAAEAGGTSPRVGGPEVDVRASSEIPEAEAPARAVPEGGLAASPPATSAAAPAPMAGAAEKSTARDEPANTVVTSSHIRAAPPTPEAWYATIESLRKAGRDAEADAELARFEAAYPDWIKQHRRHRP